VVDLKDAKASMTINDLAVEDYHDITNALKDGPSVPANVSFQMHWSGVQSRVHLHDDTNEFDADVIEDSATIAWSASKEDFTFVSTAGGAFLEWMEGKTLPGVAALQG